MRREREDPVSMLSSSSSTSTVTEGEGGDSSSHESMNSPSTLNHNSHEEMIFEYGHPRTPLPSWEPVELPEEMNVEGFHYAVSSRKGPGRGKLMEDTHKAMTVHILLPPEDSKSEFRKVKASFFGVFDGHCDWKAADFAAQNLGHNIFNSLVEAKGREQCEDIDSVNKDDVFDKKKLEQAVRAGYLRTDDEFLKLGIFGGTTCVTALIIDGKLVVSHAGDSRAVISRRSRHGDCREAEAEALTCDHKPGREEERKRIEKLGGSVTDHSGISRVGAMAVSRAIGDRFIKKFLSAEPETKIIEILSDCEFVILASDGMWDVVSNQEAVDIVRPFYIQEQGGSLLDGCRKLVEVAVARQSKDDISVMIVGLLDFWKERKEAKIGRIEHGGTEHIQLQ